MEDMDIYGTGTRGIPNLNTLKTLEKRKSYILKKLEKKIEKESYLLYFIEEIRALEKVTNFLQWINNNSSDDAVQKVFEKYELETNVNTEDKIETDNDSEKGEVIYGAFEDRFHQNHLIEIVLSKYNGNNYILLESKRRKPDKVTWKKEGKIKMTLQRLEKILKKANGLESNNSGTFHNGHNTDI